MEQVTVKAQAANRVAVRGTAPDVVVRVADGDVLTCRVRGVPEIGGAVASLRGDAGLVAGTRGSARLIDFEPDVTPHILSFSLEATGANLYLQSVVWTPSALVRFRVEDLTAGGYVYSEMSSSGTMDLLVSISGEMVVGHQYRLAVMIDTIPDVVGWDDSAYTEFDPQIQWIQPDRFSAPVEYDYVSEEDDG